MTRLESRLVIAPHVHFHFAARSDGRAASREVASPVLTSAKPFATTRASSPIFVLRATALRSPSRGTSPRASLPASIAASHDARRVRFETEVWHHGLNYFRSFRSDRERGTPLAVTAPAAALPWSRPARARQLRRVSEHEVVLRHRRTRSEHLTLTTVKRTTSAEGRDAAAFVADLPPASRAVAETYFAVVRRGAHVETRDEMTPIAARARRAELVYRSSEEPQPIQVASAPSVVPQTQAKPVVPAVDIQRVTSEVMRQIERRVRIEREGRGLL